MCAASHMSSPSHMSLPDNAPRPRLAHVTKWPHFDGYGFNLHAEKARPGQFVGKVDPGSPAEAAGLRQGDRVVEVNGVNVNHENHRQVVQRIKAVPEETRLLVVDPETDAFYRRSDIVVTGNMNNVRRMSSKRLEEADRGSVDSDHSAASSTTEKEDPSASIRVEKGGKDEEAELTPKITGPEEEAEEEDVTDPSAAEEKPFSSSTTSGSTPRSTPSPELPSLRSDWDGLNLNMTAAEMRNRLSSRKKKDPRKDDRMDFKKKFDIIDGL